MYTGISHVNGFEVDGVYTNDYSIEPEVGGDITGGVQSFWQLFVRPLGRWGAYSTPVRGLYVCSSSMPPGAGVHGMCGHLAAKLALKEVL